MKEYRIFLDDKIIGTTNFEFADVPMGVVFGKVNFINIENAYSYFVNLCKNLNIDFNFNEEEKYLQTFIIGNIKIFYNENLELIGNGASFNGFDNDFQIEFYGITSELMKSEFLHHYYDYYDET